MITTTAESHEAKIIACKSYMQTYNAQTATISDAHSYADCVNATYPMQIDASGVIALKIMIVVTIIATIFSGIKGFREGGIVGCLLYSLLCIVGIPMSSFLIGVPMYYCIMFLFS